MNAAGTAALRAARCACLFVGLLGLGACPMTMPVRMQNPASTTSALPAGFGSQRLGTSAAAYPIDALTWQGVPISHQAFDNPARYGALVEQGPQAIGRALHAVHLMRSPTGLDTVVDDDTGHTAVRYLPLSSVARYYSCRNLQGQGVRCEDLEFFPIAADRPLQRRGHALIQGAGNEITVEKTRDALRGELAKALPAYAVRLPLRMLVAHHVEVGRYERQLGGLTFPGGALGGPGMTVAGSFGIAEKDRLFGGLHRIRCEPDECERILRELDPKATGRRGAVIVFDVDVVGMRGAPRAPWQAGSEAQLELEVRGAALYADSVLSRKVHTFPL